MKISTSEVHLASQNVQNIFSTISNHLKKKNAQIFISNEVLINIKKYGDSFNITSFDENENKTSFFQQKWQNHSKKTNFSATFLDDCVGFYRLIKFKEIKDETVYEYSYTNSGINNLLFILPLN